MDSGLQVRVERSIGPDDIQFVNQRSILDGVAKISPIGWSSSRGGNGHVKVGRPARRTKSTGAENSDFLHGWKTPKDSPQGCDILCAKIDHFNPK